MTDTRRSETTASDRSARPVRRRTAIAVGVAALAVVAITLGGFVAWVPVTDALHKQHREDFADRATAETGWVGTSFPDWIPADATDIHNLATTNETYSVIRVRSSSKLPEDCVRTPRHGMPSLTASWAPNPPPMPDTVWVCGRYEVTGVPGGWLGWFQAQTPGDTPDA